MSEEEMGMGAASAADPWSRPALFVRLTKRRKAMLRAVAEGLPGGASPAEALEAAIESSASRARAAPEAELARKIEDLDEALANAERERKLDADRQGALSVQALRQLEGLFGLISGGEAEPAAAPAAEEPRALGPAAWLSRALGPRSANARSALAKALWRRAERGADGLGSMELDASLAAVDGARPPGSVSFKAALRIEALDLRGPAFAAIASQAGRPCAVAFERVGEAWRARVLRLEEEGAPPHEIAALDV